MEKITNERTGMNRHILEMNMLGRSPALIQVLKTIKRMAQCDAEVLIEGETGTGKELAARSLHYSSPRGEKAFIAVNCGAIPDTLIESELFGYCKGAFTDAKSKHAGVVEQASGGTLFLDEIEALSPKGQVALLRFIQDKQYRPLGASKTYEADVRVITASNECLSKMMTDGAFRKDLYYRLNLMNIRMPPLRERGEDVLILADYFVNKYACSYKKKIEGIAKTAKYYLLNHDWPGNVRELENLIHREVLLANGRLLNFHADEMRLDECKTNQTGHSSFFVSLEQDFNHAKATFLEMFEREYLEKLLESTQGNVTMAAKLAGKERRCLGKLIKKHGLDKEQYRNQIESQ